MKARALLPLALLLTLLLAACGGQSEPATTTPPTTAATTAPVDGASLYADAVESISGRKDLVLKITIDKTLDVGQETTSQLSRQTLNYTGLGTDDMAASMKERIYLDDVELSLTEYYADGVAYFAVDGGHFRQEMTGDEFRSRYVPMAMLDSALYGSVTADDSGTDTEITFQQPTAIENWVVGEEVELISATGSATLNRLGRLEKSVYDVTYVYGPATIHQVYTLEIEDGDPKVEQLSNPDIFVPADYPDGLRAMMLAKYELQRSQSVTSNSSATITSQAGGIVYATGYTMNTWGTDDDLLTQVDYQINLMDYSVNQTQTYHQVERYEDGKYTITVDDEEPTSNTLYSDQMEAYFDNLLLTPMPTTTYLTGATMTDLGETLLIEFTADEVYAKGLCSAACNQLYGDGNRLNDLASDYQTQAATTYLAVNKYTGFPSAAGISYAGVHTIEGTPYLLAIEECHSYQLASLTAYETLSGEPLDDGNYAEATPLLYQVSDDQGHTLYLFGTIHVGDSRTGKLPDYVYNAFDSADALAVEFDAGSFLEQSESDPELQAMVMENMFYTDGTTLANHLSESVYSQALLHLMASGNYSSTALMMKPCSLESIISDFFLSQGWRLTSESGVDMRLLQRAKAAGKEILEVESAQLQLALLGNFSDPLQELLLRDTLETGGKAYRESVEALFALWCAGDPDDLRAAVNEEIDSADYTEEELALVAEYEQALGADRNAGMLATAQEYLQSGKTVFYAVGLAHMLEDGSGLVDALRAAGYTVEQVK